MSMVCGLDLHRGQITFDALVPQTGETWRGRISSPDRARFRRWLTTEVAPRAREGSVDIAVEGCCGWRYVVEEITTAGFTAHLAEPADTQAKRGRKKRAKTDRSDSRLQRDLLAKGELPESWIPPTGVLEWRERAQIYKSLVDERRVWIQRIHAECFHQGLPLPEAQIASTQTRAWLENPETQLSPAGLQRIVVGYRMIDAVQGEITPLRAQLRDFASRQPACRALMKNHFGVGPIVSLVVWSQLGDCQRFTRSMQAVRHSGLDITVHESDFNRRRGWLAREGAPILRWALFEAAKFGSRAASPDHHYYQAVKDRHDGKIATLALARKVIRRCYHTLRAIDPEEVYLIPQR